MQKLKMKEQEKLIVFEASINSPKVMVRGRSDSESKIGDGWSKKKFPAFMDATISE